MACLSCLASGFRSFLSCSLFEDMFPTRADHHGTVALHSVTLAALRVLDLQGVRLAVANGCGLRAAVARGHPARHTEVVPMKGVLWEHSTSILKLCLSGPLDCLLFLMFCGFGSLSSFLGTRSFKAGELGCLLLSKSRGSGRFVACRAQRGSSFPPAFQLPPGAGADGFPLPCLPPSLPPVFLTAAKAIFLVEYKIPPSRSRTPNAPAASRSTDSET